MKTLLLFLPACALAATCGGFLGTYLAFHTPTAPLAPAPRLSPAAELGTGASPAPQFRIHQPYRQTPPDGPRIVFSL